METAKSLPPELHPLIARWFAETWGRPTAVQEAAWPLIFRGEHVLALAPTGSGKTLTAFLAAISRLASGEYPADRLSVIYLSPLKALNEDIRRNLLEPLGAIRARFLAADLPFPEIRAETRSGDTPQGERRRFLERPPSILALTPESLGILLLNPRGREVLSQVKYLIMDEIHAVLGNKRGSFLACQVDRLGLCAGEFQRIGLSATVRPPERAAAFVGGLRPLPAGEGEEIRYEGRPVKIAAPPADKKIDFRLEFPENRETEEGGDRYGRRYSVLTDYILGRLSAEGPLPAGGRPGTVLVFTDSRRRAERISYLVNEKAGRTVAYTHHGSLSRELRREVERALAEGKLPCVAATGSLELGIDIGSVAEVILAGIPQTAAAALQRVGRSGHGVGETSRGRILPFNGLELLAAAALTAAVEDREIEETRPVENPLDILAQIVLALCAEKPRPEAGLFTLIRGFYPFKTLSREAYQGVIGMLTGRFAGERLRELRPRLFRDGETGELTAAPGALSLLYSSGGVIPSRGYYAMRLADGTRIGELDEEFVWERRLGDSFDFGARPWRITAIGAEAVEVVPLEKSADFSPFWKAEAAFRSPLLVRRILELLDRLGEGPSGANAGESGGAISPAAQEALENLAASQRRAQGGVPLPGTASLPVEIIDDPANRGEAWTVILHSFRGAAVNQPLSLALARDLETVLVSRVECTADDNGILFRLPRTEDPEDLIRRSLLRLGTEGWEKPFRERFESSGTFGALFREAAERALLLPKAFFGKRTPLWVLRQRSRGLFDAVRAEPDFPVTAEAWRSALEDLYDPEGLGGLLAAIREGTAALSFFRTSSASPFARDLLWKETNTLMYQYDERPDLRGGREGPPAGGEGVSLTSRVIAEALDKAAARPPLEAQLVESFTARLRRELPGWAAEDGLSLAEWVKERIAIPLDEWEKLKATLSAALPEEPRENLSRDPSLGGRIQFLRRAGAALPSAVHREWAEIWEEDPLSRLGPWLRYQSPLSPSRIGEIFGTGEGETAAALDALEKAGELVRDVAIRGGEGGLVCDRENLDLLLRLGRRKARPAIRERPLDLLAPYLALRQGLLGGTGAANRGQEPWGALRGLPAAAKLWETDFLPARQAAYTGESLAGAVREGRLLWYGAGKERIALVRPEDLELFPPAGPEGLTEKGAGPGNPLLMRLGPAWFDIPRDFWTMKEAAALDIPSCAAALWEAVWEGRLAADSWEPLRRALETGFSLRESPPVPPPAYGQGRGLGRRSPRQARLPRALRDRWREGPPLGGHWFSLETAEEEGAADSLEEEELNRERVRLLLTRWGILCRPLLEREAPALSWSRLLPAIRRLELAGELTAGRFFAGINSLQFASPAIAGELEAAEAVQGLWWMNAADPASPAGLDPTLPPRLGTTRLCFRDGRLAALSRRNGRDLEILIPPEDPELPEALSFVKIPRLRAIRPERSLSVETINRQTAAASPFAAALKTLGFVPDRGKLVLW